ncbi:LOW QUALITY PROTEIN: translation initiation factor IF-2 [Drosophila ficusphila]|uniref:LOW QUALITY PROTEIN: translation initiation factor IF-2 n=1 Tax=Drosophila ficusphila TaxID=30025 RepID=UPI0007E7B6F6|nr:LOW QUALITY PROTEIN: translation initiation factor IF-2 [Drosophila ficusphila]
MKFSAALALLLVAGLVARSDALPARKRMVYLQQPAAAEWYGSAPQQRFMYMQYVQPGRTHARSTQAASALVAGETVATGTYLKDCNHAESELGAEEVRGEDVLAAAGAHGVSSVAEAYPDQVPVVQVAIDADVVPAPQPESEAEPEPVPENEPADDAAKVPRDFNFPAEEAAVPAAEESVPLPVAAAELPAPAPIAPVAAVVPANRYLPAKKKVIVELDQSPEEDEEPQAAAIEDDEELENAVADDVEEEEEVLLAPAKPVNPVRVPNARRPVAKKPAKAAAPAGGKPAKKPAAPLPAGTFFPIDFGGTNGGAIAIANSFSTGEGGSATSHAIAYGSPESAARRVRPNPSKFRH